MDQDVFQIAKLYKLVNKAQSFYITLFKRFIYYYLQTFYQIEKYYYM